MREEITVTVQLVYDCPADQPLAEQSDMIQTDLQRLLDEDSTTGVACCEITIHHAASEAETYGNLEPMTEAEVAEDERQGIAADQQARDREYFAEGV